MPLAVLSLVSAIKPVSSFHSVMAKHFNLDFSGSYCLLVCGGDRRLFMLKQYGTGKGILYDSTK